MAYKYKQINIMELNAYKLTHVVLIARTGIVTQADAKKIRFSRDFSKRYATRFYGTKERAIFMVEELRSNVSLSKDYDVLMITDKQFGMIETQYVNGKCVYKKDYGDVATDSQLKNVFQW